METGRLSEVGWLEGEGDMSEDWWMGGKTYLKLGGGDDNHFECWRFESMIEG